MSILRLAVVVVAVSACASAASAQMGGNTAGQGAVRQGRIGEQFSYYALDMMTAEWRQSTAPHRVRRAEKAAAMINGGDCAGARRLVAHDPLMAYRVNQACAQFEITDPVSIPEGQGTIPPPDTPSLSAD